MSVAFPTGKVAPYALGFPSRARHCVCVGGSMLIAGQDECVKCGKTPKDEIAGCWSDRAREVKQQNASRKRKAAERKARRKRC